ncbi:MAG TPA: hypothetical protein VJC37_03350 [Planctomycetota bacterium]|nr:hypothetical protein [Planctomycetota bacterium]
MERCRNHMPCGAGCTGHVPRVKPGALTTEKQLEAFTCSLLHLCRYCYRMRFGPRSHGKVNTSMLNSAQIRERFIRFHREPAKRLYAPAFYKGMAGILEDLVEGIRKLRGII